MKVEFSGSGAVLFDDDGNAIKTFAIHFSPMKAAPIAQFEDINGLTAYADVTSISPVTDSPKVPIKAKAQAATEPDGK